MPISNLYYLDVYDSNQSLLISMVQTDHVGVESSLPVLHRHDGGFQIFGDAVFRLRRLSQCQRAFLYLGLVSTS